MESGESGKLTDLAKAFALKKLPDSEAEFVGEVPADTIAPYREDALKHLAADVEMPGFRKGHVPQDMVAREMGEVAILEHAVEHFMQEFYPVLMTTHNIDAVGRPGIEITKLAPGNPVGLTIRTALYPTVVLPKNWKSVGASIPAEPAALATDEDVEKTIESLRQSRAVREEGKDPVLPEVTDEFAKSLGAFENLAALKEQIKKGIGEEKERAARDARRGKIIDAILADTQMEIPRIFVESEQDKIIAQMQEDVSRMGLAFDDYLKHSGKTEEQLREDFREQAHKRAKLQLVLNKIAEEEKVEADKDAVETEIGHALQHFPEAKPELLRIHIETVLRNEKVLQMLENPVTK